MTAWPQVVASLLDGCEIVLVRPPAGQLGQLRVEHPARQHGRQAGINGTGLGQAA
jgi:hypothetical protein